MLYRIYVGPGCGPEVHEILLSNGIDSYSTEPRFGCWKGVKESSFVIEIFDLDGSLEGRIRTVAEIIRAASAQEIVYIVSLPVEAIRAITV